MKIAQLETLRVPEHPNLVWARIHTADGLIGLQDGFVNEPGELARSLLKQRTEQMKVWP